MGKIRWSLIVINFDGLYTLERLKRKIWIVKFFESEEKMRNMLKN